MELISKETNHRKESPNLTWKNLKEELDDDLFFKVQELALKYGYSIED